jgi:hypothetical protein
MGALINRNGAPKHTKITKITIFALLSLKAKPGRSGEKTKLACREYQV